MIGCFSCQRVEVLWIISPRFRYLPSVATEWGAERGEAPQRTDAAAPSSAGLIEQGALRKTGPESWRVIPRRLSARKRSCKTRKRSQSHPAFTQYIYIYHFRDFIPRNLHWKIQAGPERCSKGRANDETIWGVGQRSDLSATKCIIKELESSISILNILNNEENLFPVSQDLNPYDSQIDRIFNEKRWTVESESVLPSGNLLRFASENCPVKMAQSK